MLPAKTPYPESNASRGDPITGQMRTDFLAYCDRTRGNAFKLKKGSFRYKREAFYNERAGTLA